MAAEKLTRTSASDPLVVAELFLKKHKLTIGITMMPGRKGLSMSGPAWERDLAADLQVVRDWRPDRIIHIRTTTMSYPGIGATDVLDMDHHAIATGDLHRLAEDLIRDHLHAGMSARWLIVSDQGLVRAGYLSGALLRLLDEEPDPQRIAARINTVQPDAVELPAQIAFFASLTPARVTAAVLLRARWHRSEHPGLLCLKDEARALRASGAAASHSAALEAVARAHGYASWNAARARIARSPRSVWIRRAADGGEPEQPCLRETLAFLGLDRPGADPAQVGVRLEQLMDRAHGQPLERDMWYERMRFRIEGQLPAFCAWHDMHGLPVSGRALTRLFEPVDRLGTLFYLEAGLAGENAIAASRTLETMMDFIPGFDLIRWARDGRPSDNDPSLTHLGFISLMPLKTLRMACEGEIDLSP